MIDLVLPGCAGGTWLSEGRDLRLLAQNRIANALEVPPELLGLAWPPLPPFDPPPYFDPLS